MATVPLAVDHIVAANHRQVFVPVLPIRYDLHVGGLKLVATPRFVNTSSLNHMTFHRAGFGLTFECCYHKTVGYGEGGCWVGVDDLRPSVHELVSAVEVLSHIATNVLFYCELAARVEIVKLPNVEDTVVQDAELFFLLVHSAFELNNRHGVVPDVRT